MSQTGDSIPREEYWAVRTAYEAGVSKRMAGWDGFSVPTSPVPGDVEYDARVATGRAAYDAAHGILTDCQHKSIVAVTGGEDCEDCPKTWRHDALYGEPDIDDEMTESFFDSDDPYGSFKY